MEWRFIRILLCNIYDSPLLALQGLRGFGQFTLNPLRSRRDRGARHHQLVFRVYGLPKRPLVLLGRVPGGLSSAAHQFPMRLGVASPAHGRNMLVGSLPCLPNGRIRGRV
jgi:hypothetical protein